MLTAAIPAPLLAVSLASGILADKRLYVPGKERDQPFTLHGCVLNLAWVHLCSPWRRAVFDIDGGASSGVLPHCSFGLSPISRTSVPPPAISACVNHGLFRALPLSCADCMYLFCADA